MKKKVLKIFLLLLVIVLVLVVFKNEIFILIEDVSNSFYRTVIEEQRYELLFEGFLSTTIISIMSIILGTLMGIVIYYLRKCHYEIIKKISTVSWICSWHGALK